MSYIDSFFKDTNGDAIVVKAVILFPIMIMIFAGITLLSIYLPQRAVLHNAAQQAANILAKDLSDTGFYFTINSENHVVESWNFNLHPFPATDRSSSFIYRAFSPFSISENELRSTAEQIVLATLENSFTIASSADVIIEVDSTVTLLYRHIEVTVRQEIPFRLNLSFIGFPSSLNLEQTASVFVADGSSFLRGIDDAMALSDTLERTPMITTLITYLPRFMERTNLLPWR